MLKPFCRQKKEKEPVAKKVKVDSDEENPEPSKRNIFASDSEDEQSDNFGGDVQDEDSNSDSGHASDDSDDVSVSLL